MNPQEHIVIIKIFQILAASFLYISAIALLIGPERKSKWFKRRQKYTFFTHRGILGQYLNFGYPCTWQGMGIFIAIYGVIIPVSYWYVFM